MTCARCGHCHCCGADRAIQPPWQVTTTHPYWLDYPLSPNPNPPAYADCPLQPQGSATYA